MLSASESKNLDTRRWSFASIHSTSSSGYGGGSSNGGGTNTPPIHSSLPQNQAFSSININTDNNSNPSSIYSSNEKILGTKCSTQAQSVHSNKLICERKNSNESNTSSSKQQQKTNNQNDELEQQNVVKRHSICNYLCFPFDYFH